MNYAIKVSSAGEWPVEEARDRVTLPYESRCRRRIRLNTDSGRDLFLDLSEAKVMKDGDGLMIKGGGWIALYAAKEPLVEITCSNKQDLFRICWHLGNRHLPAEICENYILIRNDYVIVNMIRGLSGKVRFVEAPFNPEGGAYRSVNLDDHVKFSRL